MFFIIHVFSDSLYRLYSVKPSLKPSRLGCDVCVLLQSTQFEALRYGCYIKNGFNLALFFFYYFSILHILS